MGSAIDDRWNIAFVVIVVGDVVVDPRNISLKFGLNQVINR